MVGDKRSELTVACCWLLLLAICAWAYWPGLDGPSLLDDGANLRILEQLEDESVSLYGVVVGNKSGPFGRYLSMLSFGLEKIWFDGGLRGTKLYNLALHLFIASILLLFSRDVFRALDSPAPMALACSVAALWLVAPLLLSTVLYTVQRMAQLSALFVLLSLWSYLRARRSMGAACWLWGGACALAAVCAPLAKENGILVFPLLLLLEYQLLSYSCATDAGSTRLKRLHLSALLIGVAAAITLPLVRPDFLLSGYAMRDFSLQERLLTESRILWTYVLQLTWVDPNRLGIFHDHQEISRSLLQPLTTLWSVLAWSACALLLLLCIWKRLAPAVVFGVAFFLVAHSMESTVIPLELYFEHRNYLPAMGFFIAVVGGISLILQRSEYLGPWFVLLLLLVLSRNIMCVATEALIWSEHYLFQFAAANRFPDSERGNADSARTLALGGDIEEALAYSRRTRELSNGSPLAHDLRDLTLYCQAAVNPPPAWLNEISGNADDFRDDNVAATAYVLVKEILDGRCARINAFAIADLLTRLAGAASSPEAVAPKYYLSLAILENYNQRYDRGLVHVEQLLSRDPDHSRALLMKLYFAGQLQLADPYDEAMKALLDLDASGRLDEDQRRNLEAFLPHAE